MLFWQQVIFVTNKQEILKAAESLQFFREEQQPRKSLLWKQQGQEAPHYIVLQDLRVEVTTLAI